MTYTEFCTDVRDYCDDVLISYPTSGALLKMYPDYEEQADDPEFGWNTVSDWIEENEIDFKDYEPVKPTVTKVSYWNTNGTFSTYTPQPVAVYADCTKDNTMTDTATQRNYLLGRVNDIRYTLRANLEKQFNLYKSNAPRTYAELIEYIKEGKYELDTKKTKRIDDMVEAHGIEFVGQDPFNGIKWTGRPGEDFEGYNVAEKEMQKEIQKTKDVIMSDVYADGLAALQALEAWTPTTKPN